MTFAEFNRWLLDNSGVSTRVLYSLWGQLRDEKPLELETSLFFKPYKSPLHTLGRGINIVTDPIILTYAAVVEVLTALYYLCDSIWNAINSDKETAIESIGISATSFLTMIAEVVVAAISPVVNLIDLIGGGIASVACDAEEDVIGGPAYN